MQQVQETEKKLKNNNNNHVKIARMTICGKENPEQLLCFKIREKNKAFFGEIKFAKVTFLF